MLSLCRLILVLSVGPQGGYDFVFALPLSLSVAFLGIGTQAVPSTGDEALAFLWVAVGSGKGGKFPLESATWSPRIH